MSRTPRLIVANDDPRNRVMTTLSVTEAVQIVRENPSTRFARDLVAAFDNYGDRINGNKRAWLLVIAQQTVDRAQQRAAAPREEVRITEDFAGLTAVLTKARESGKKFPKIALRTADGLPVVLSLAGDKSKAPGSVQVTDGGKFGDNVWYGRVEPSGAWVGGRDASPDVLELLRRFAADPQGVAAAYGRETGECCFCQAELTDERSVLQGYGPVCAERHGLPWGERPAAPRQGELPLGGDDQEAELARAERANERPTDFQIQQQARERRERQHDAHYAALERRRELEGFASDPDYSGFLASGGPSRPLGLEELLEVAAASAGRDGYFPPARERALAVAASAPWRDDD